MSNLLLRLHFFFLMLGLSLEDKYQDFRPRNCSFSEIKIQIINFGQKSCGAFYNEYVIPVYNDTTPYDLNNIGNFLDQKTLDYSLSYFSSSYIDLGDSAIILGFSNTNRQLHLLKIFSDFYIFLSLTLSATLDKPQESSGLGENDNGYFVSYITSNKEGVISEFDSSLTSITEHTIISSFTKHNNRIFKCYYLKDEKNYLCLAFIGSERPYNCTISYKIIILNIDFTQLREIPREKTFDSNSDLCFVHTTYIDIYQMTSDTFLIFFKLYGNAYIEVYKWNNSTPEIFTKSHEKKYIELSDKNHNLRKGNYYKLNEDYLMILDNTNGAPVIYQIYIPTLLLMNKIKATHSTTDYSGYDILLLDESTNTYLLFGKDIFYEFTLLTCKNEVITTQGLNDIIDIVSLSNFGDINYTLRMCFIEKIPDKGTELEIKGNIYPGQTNQNIELYETNSQCYRDLTFSFVKPGKYIIKYFLQRNFVNGVLVIPSTICELTIQKECYSTCSECESKGDSTDHKCTVCKDDYYLLENSQNCYEEQDLPSDHYKTIDNNIKMFKKCGSKCKTCSTGSTSTNDNCDTCQDTLFFIEDEIIGNCYPPPGDGYYYDSQSKMYKKCYSKCLTCSEYGESKCLSCKSQYYLMSPFDNTCYDQCPDGYIVESNSKNCIKPCYQSCATCNTPSDSSNHNCLSCNPGYYFYEDDTTTCDQTCRDGYYQSGDQCKKCYDTCLTCSSSGTETTHNCNSCKGNLKLIGTNCIFVCEAPTNLKYKNDYGEYKCVSSCPSTHPYLINDECLKDCGDLYLYNNKCYSTCPSGTIRDITSHTCKDIISDIQEDPSSNDDITHFTSNESIDNFIEYIDNAVTLSIRSQEEKGNTCTIIETSEIIYSFYSSNDNTNLDNKIDLGQCEDLLRDYYNLTNDEKIYIGIMNMKNDTAKPYQVTAYEVYDSNGRYLNLSVCDGVKIKETKKINVDSEILKFKLAEQLYIEQGINIFDENEDVFNDKCAPLEIDGKDTTLSDRNTKIKNNINLCGDNCEAKSFDFQTEQVECDCEPQTKKINVRSFVESNEMVSEITEVIGDTNFELFACYQGIKDINRLNKNYGGLIGIILISLEIICIIIFQCKQINSILLFMSKKHPIPNPPKQNNVYIYTDSNQFDTSYKEKPSIPTVNSSDNLGALPQSEIIEDDPEELNEMEYEEAIENDKRNFCRYYLDIISEKQFLLSPILYKSAFRPLSLKMSMFFFCLLTFFFINAMFFTEEYISKRFDSDDKLNFAYIIKHELKKSILASLVTAAISKLFSFLLTRASSFYKLLESKEEKDFNYSLLQYINKMKKKFIVLFVLMIVFSLLFLYFLMCFCRIYRNNQISWIESTLISILSNMILYFVLCLIIAILRFSAFKCANEIVYKAAMIIYDII